MRYLLLLLIFSINFSISAQNEHLHHRVKVHLEGQSIQVLAALGLEVDHGHYAPLKHLINDFSDRELTIISDAGFSYEVLTPHIEHYYANPLQNLGTNGETSRGGPICSGNENSGDAYPYLTPSNFQLGTMAGFYRYDEMLAILDSMRILYPNLISSRQMTGNISTHEGHPVFWLRVSDNPDTDETTEPEVLYTALHHAREPNSLSQMIFYIWYLLENYDSDPEIQYLIDNTELYFMPCVNPDGYIFNEMIEPNGGGLWRKNRKENGGGSMGVDLNRNYGFQWGFDNDGSSPNPQSETYRGTAGFSEPETQAVKFLCDQHEFLVTLNYHTYGNLLIYPWGYSDSHTDDSLTFTTIADIMTQQNNYFAGTGTETVGYTVNGDSDDWMYGETGTKPSILSLTPEVGTGGFWPSINDIIPNCKASVWMNMIAANTPHIAGIATADPNQFEITETNPFLKFQVQRFGLTDGSLMVSLASLQTNVITVSEEPKIYNLAANELILDSFALSPITDIAAGSELAFLLTIDNGSFTRTDTVRRAFGGFITSPVFNDALDNISNWTSSDWGITDESFVSAPTSLTDSPYGDYSNNSINEIVLNDAIIVGNAEQYKLKFSARWDIESFYDYAQLLFRINGEGWIPACGRYTVLGSEVQDTDQPLWEGTQNDWIEEEIDLTSFLSAGDQIELKFILVSDQFVNPDGFYVDDIMLEEQTMETVGTTYLSNDDFNLSISPNPAQSESLLQFRLNSSIQGQGQWQIHHSNGNILKQGHLNLQNGYDQIQLNTSNLPAGIYWVSAKGNEWQIPAQKLVLVKG